MSDAENAVVRLQTLWLHEGSEHINALHWSYDNTLVAAAYADGSVAVFEALSGEPLWRESAHGMDASAVQWSHDSKCLASGGQSGGVILWNVREGTVAQRLECGKGWIEHLRWGPGQLLACACGTDITLWTAQGILVQRFEPSLSTITGLQWLPDGRLFSSCYGMVTQWTAEQVNPRRFYPWKDSLLNVSISPDERFLATGCQDSSVHLWHVDSGEDFQMSGYPAKIKHLSWSFDGRYFATASSDLVVIWDCAGSGPQNTEPVMLPVHDRAVTALAFSHGSHRMISGGHEGLVFVFDAGQKEPLAGLHVGASVGAVAWSHNDKLLAVGGGQGHLQICVVPE